MSEDLRTDHVKLESPSILTKHSFCPAIGGPGPPGPSLVYAGAAGESVLGKRVLQTDRIDPSRGVGRSADRRATDAVDFWPPSAPAVTSSHDERIY